MSDGISKMYDDMREKEEELDEIANRELDGVLLSMSERAKHLLDKRVRLALVKFEGRKREIEAEHELRWFSIPLPSGKGT